MSGCFLDLEPEKVGADLEPVGCKAGSVSVTGERAVVLQEVLFCCRRLAH